MPIGRKSQPKCSIFNRNNILISMTIGIVFIVIISNFLILFHVNSIDPNQDYSLRTTYSIHNPIRIDDNSGFINESGVVWGVGSEADPYLIDGLEISALMTDCISIANTTAYVNIQNMYLHSAFGAAINLQNTTNIMIVDNIITDNGWASGKPGIRISNSSDISVINNYLISNNFGIFAYSSLNVNISMNEISGGDQLISIQSSINFLINSNNFSDCFYGVSLHGCSNITVYHNNFNNNFMQASDDRGSENSWDIGYPEGGNYWSDYAGADNYSGINQNISGSDGIGDSPYIIDANSSDRYPFMTNRGNNTSPVASFEVYPTVGNQTTPFTFNASNSSDAEDPIILLQFRWDFDGDGTWDTFWSGSQVVQFWYYYHLPDNYTVCLEVRDKGGMTNSTSKNITLIKDTPYLMHDVIRIASNSEFTYSNGVINGNGTESNPYLIMDWEIYVGSTWGIGIDISNTNSHFIIRHVRLYSSGSWLTQKGICFNNVVNGKIENSSLETLREGIYVYDSSNYLIRNCSVTNCLDGFKFGNNYNFSISSNIFSGNQRGISLDSSSDTINILNNSIESNSFGIIGDISTNRNLIISNNTIISCLYGIYLRFDINVMLINNIFIENSYVAMNLEYITNILIKNNIIANNGFGIANYDCINSTILNNTFLNNSLGIWGDQLRHYTNYVIENNSVNGRPIIYLKNLKNVSLCGTSLGELILVNCSNSIVTNLSIMDLTDLDIELAFVNNTRISECNLSGDILLLNSNNISISKNNLIDCDTGIQMYYGVEFNISDNNISKSGNGIYIIDCSNGLISYNSICNNAFEGIDLSSSSDIMILGNIICQNDIGIYLYESTAISMCLNNLTLNNDSGIFFYESSDNAVWNNSIQMNVGYGISIQSGTGNCIWNNSFIRNHGSSDFYDPMYIQACDNSSGNWWNNSMGYGNFWLDWTIPDDDFDGIVDSPYNISGTGGAKDYYPISIQGIISEPSIIFLSVTIISIILLLNQRIRKKEEFS